MKKHFVTGLVLLLPGVLTLGIFLFLINLLTRPFIGFTSHLVAKWDLFSGGLFFLSQTQIIEYASRIFILLALFFFLVLLGIVARWFFLHSLIKLCDQLLMRIPFINSIYKTSKDVIKTLFSTEKKAFQQVVLAPFPRPGVYVVGLIADKAPLSFSEKLGKELISVLVPTAPNPTTGFLIMIPQEDLVYLEIKAEDAIKYVISCGVILPGGTQSK